MNNFRLNIGDYEHGSYIITIQTKYTESELLEFYNTALKKLPEKFHPNYISSKGQSITVGDFIGIDEFGIDFCGWVPDKEENPKEKVYLDTREYLEYLIDIIRFGGADDIKVIREPKIIITLDADSDDYRFQTCYE